MNTIASILIVTGVQLFAALQPGPFRLATMGTVISKCGCSCAFATSLGVAIGVAMCASLGALVWISFAISIPHKITMLMNIAYVLLLACLLIRHWFPYQPNVTVGCESDLESHHSRWQRLVAVGLNVYGGIVLACKTYDAMLLSFLLVAVAVATGDLWVVCSAIGIMASVQFSVLAINGCIFARHIRQNLKLHSLNPD
jgi:hypothetical protein